MRCPCHWEINRRLWNFSTRDVASTVILDSSRWKWSANTLLRCIPSKWSCVKNATEDFWRKVVSNIIRYVLGLEWLEVVSGMIWFSLLSTSLQCPKQKKSSSVAVTDHPKQMNDSQIQFRCNFCPFTAHSDEAIQLHVTATHNQPLPLVEVKVEGDDADVNNVTTVFEQSIHIKPELNATILNSDLIANERPIIIIADFVDLTTDDWKTLPTKLTHFVDAQNYSNRKYEILFRFSRSV